jgi:hypothetical protein
MWEWMFSSTIFYLDAGWSSVVRFTLLLLYNGKEPLQYPLDKRQMGTRADLSAMEKKHLALAEVKPWCWLTTV